MGVVGGDAVGEEGVDGGEGEGDDVGVGLRCGGGEVGGVVGGGVVSGGEEDWGSRRYEGKEKERQEGQDDGRGWVLRRVKEVIGRE